MSKGSQALSVLLLLTLVSALIGCGQPARFDPAAFNDPGAVQKAADTYWKREGWWGGMKGVQKVAISQFCVEYVTQNVDKSGADAISILGVMEMGGMGKRQRVFDETFKQEYPNQLYQEFVSALKTAGYEVVPLETLTASPAFADFKAATGPQKLNQGGRGSSAKIQVYPVKGLPLPDDGFLGLGAGNNYKAEFRMVGESGAQADLKVRIRVGLDDEGRAIIGGGSTVYMFYAPEKFKGMNGDEWTFKERGQVTGGPQLRDDQPVIDSKEFKMFQGDIYTVNSDKFRASINKMFPAYARMATFKIKA